jgi:hypothetical protein
MDSVSVFYHRTQNQLILEIINNLQLQGPRYLILCYRNGRDIRMIWSK